MKITPFVLLEWVTTINGGIGGTGGTGALLEEF
jgi:hypothetical protein